MGVEDGRAYFCDLSCVRILLESNLNDVNDSRHFDSVVIELEWLQNSQRLYYGEEQVCHRRCGLVTNKTWFGHKA